MRLRFQHRGRRGREQLPHDLGERRGGSLSGDARQRTQDDGPHLRRCESPSEIIVRPYIAFGPST